MTGQGFDPSLSQVGKTQALQLRRLLEVGKLPRPASLFCSPRRRTQETFAELSSHLAIPLQILPDLLERGSHESARDFAARVQTGIGKIESFSRPVFLCSHMDWLMEAMILIPDTGSVPLTSLHWPPGGYVAFDFNQGLWKSTMEGQIPIW